MLNIVQEISNADSSSKWAIVENLKDRLTTHTIPQCDLFIEPLLNGSIIQYGNNHSNAKEHEKFKCNYLDILQYVLDSGPEENFKFTESLKQLCLKVYRQDTSSKVRCKCIILLDHLVKKFSSHLHWETIELKKWIDVFFLDCQKKNSSLLQSALLKFLGVVSVELEDILDQYSQKLIAKILPAKLESQFTALGGKEPSLAIITGSLHGITNYLKRSLPEQECDSFTKRIYPFIKKILCPKLKFKRRDVPRAALELLGTHCPLFSEDLWSDCRTTYFSLLHWCSSPYKEDLEVALPAMSKFTLTMATILSERKYDDEAVSNLKFLLERYQDVTRSNCKGSTISVVSDAYGTLATYCSSYLGQDELRSMLSNLLDCGRKYFLLKNQRSEAQFVQLPTYIESLASIIHYIEKVPYLDVYGILELVLYLVRFFPDFSDSQRHSIYKVISLVFHEIQGRTEISTRFFREIVVESVEITCSEKPELESNDQKTPRTGLKKEPSYKSYEPLWKFFVKGNEIHKAEGISDDAVPSICNEIIQAVMWSLVYFSTPIVVKLQNGTPGKELVTETLCKMPKLPKNDIQVFENFCYLLERSLPEKLQQTMQSKQTLQIFLRSSYKNPSFTFLYPVITTLASRLYFEEEPDDVMLHELIRLTEKLLCLCHECDEDYFHTSIYLVSTMPRKVIRLLFKEIISVMKRGLKLGLKNITLAITCVEALRKWKVQLEEVEEEYFPEIIPSLFFYLSFEEPFCDDVETQISKILGKRLEDKKFQLSFLRDRKNETESPVRKVQISIIRFLSSLNPKTASTVVPSIEFSSNLPPMSEVLFELPFADRTVTINLASVVPRIIQLSMYSTDAETRIVASKVLYSFIGLLFNPETIKDDLNINISKNSSLMLSCFEAAMFLACYPNDPVQSLFRDLTFQLIRRIASSEHETKIDCSSILEIIMDGFEKNEGVLFRDFCGSCLLEYVRELKKPEIGPNHRNMKYVMTKLFNMFSDVCVRKNLAACFAWSYIAVEIDQDPGLMQTYLPSVLRNNIEALNRLGTKKSLNGYEPKITVFMNTIELSLKLLKKNAQFFMDSIEDNTGFFSKLVDSYFETVHTVSSPARKAIFKVLKEFCELTEYGCLANYVQINMKEKHCELEIAERALRENNYKLADENPFNESNGKSILQHLEALHTTVDFYVFFVKETDIGLCVCQKPESMFLKILNLFFEGMVRTFKSPEVQRLELHSVNHFSYVDISIKIMRKILKMATLSYSKFPFKIPFFSWTSFRDILGLVIKLPFLLDDPKLEFWMTEFLKVEKHVEGMQVIEEFKDFIRESLMAAYEEVSADNIGWFEENVDLSHHVRILDLLQKSDILDSKLILIVSKKFFDDLDSALFRSEESSVLIAMNLRVSNMAMILKLLRILTANCVESRQCLFKRLVDTSRVVSYYSQMITKGMHFLNCFPDEILSMAIPHTEEFKSFMLQSFSSKFHASLMQKIVEVFTEKDDLREKYLKEWIEDILIPWFELVHQENEDHSNSRKSFIQLLTSIFTVDQGILLAYINSQKDSCLLNLCLAFMRNPDMKFDEKVLVLKILKYLLKLMNHVESIRVSAEHFMETQIFGSSEDLKLSSTPDQQRRILLSELFTVLGFSKDMHIMTFIINKYCLDEWEKYDEMLPEVFKQLMECSIDAQFNILQRQLELHQEKDNDFSYRLQVLEKFLLPCLKLSHRETSIRFYSRNIQHLMASIHWEPSKAEELTSVQLEDGISSLKLLQVMYEKLDSSDIQTENSQVVKAFDADGTDCKSLIKSNLRITKFLIKRKWSYTFCAKLRNLRRLCSCAAYNTTLKLIMKTSQKSNLFLSIFFRERTDFRNIQDIFENIMDASVTYNFDMDFNMKQFESMSEFNCNASNSNLLEISSKFDFTNAVVLSESDISDPVRDMKSSMQKTKEEIGHLNYEDLKNHEVMANLAETLQVLWKSELKQSYDFSTSDMEDTPDWIQFLWNKLEYSASMHTKQFIICLICENPEIFEHFGKVLIPSLLKCIIHGVTGTGISGFTAQLLTMVLRWDKSSLLLVEPVVLSALLKLLVTNSPHVRSDFFNFNMHLLNVFVETIGDQLSVEGDYVLELLVENSDKRQLETGLKVSSILLDNKILPFDPNNSQCARRYLETIIKFLSNPSDRIVCMAAEVLGRLILHYERKEMKSMSSFVTEMLKGNYSIMKPEKRLSVVYSVQKYHPDIIDGSDCDFLLEILATLHGVPRERAYECLVSGSVLMENPSYLLERMNIKNMLTLRESSTQTLALKILKNCIKGVDTREIQEMLPNIVEPLTHPKASCRHLVYDILMLLYEIYRRKTGDREEELTLKCEDILMMAINDDDTNLRKSIINFWIKVSNEWSTSERVSFVKDKLRSAQANVSFLIIACRIILEPLMSDEDFYLSITDKEPNVLGSEALPTSSQVINDERVRHNSCKEKVFHNDYGPIQQSHMKPSLFTDDTKKSWKNKFGGKYSENRNREMLIKSRQKRVDSIQNNRKERREAQISSKREKQSVKSPDLQIPVDSVLPPLLFLVEKDLLFAFKLVFILLNAEHDETLIATDEEELEAHIQEVFHKMLDVEGHHQYLLHPRIKQILQESWNISKC